MKRIIFIVCLAVWGIILNAQSFESVRARATEKGTVLPKGTSVEGVIISDYHSLNMAQNPQVAWNRVEGRMCYSTGYLQSEDGKMGFRILFKDLYDNRVPRFSRVRIDLEGCEVTKETTPERYTLSDVPLDAVKVLGEAVPVAKKRHIGELTEADLYTLVTLEDVEFLSKEGSYTNIREFYVQSTWLNAFKKPADSDWFDEAGLYVRDNRGDALFLPVNTVCDWRRRGDRMPSGVGSVTGIVVSEELRRSGLPGPLQLRIASPSDVDIPMDGSSSYELIASWDWDRNYYYTLNCESGPRKWLEKVRIDAERVAPDKGTGWLSVTVPAQMGLDKDYNARCARDGLNAGEGNRECAAIVYDTKPLDWFNGGAVQIETSTKGFSGEGLAVEFTWLSGYGTIESAFGYPAHWKIAYSLDGTHYVPVNQTFFLRPLAWSDRTPVSYDAAVGFTENAVLLPAMLLGQEKVFIRLIPADRVAAAFHADPSERIDTGRPEETGSFALKFGRIALKALKSGE